MTEPVVDGVDYPMRGSRPERRWRSPWRQIRSFWLSKIRPNIGVVKGDEQDEVAADLYAMLLFVGAAAYSVAAFASMQLLVGRHVGLYAAVGAVTAGISALCALYIANWKRRWQAWVLLRGLTWLFVVIVSAGAVGVGVRLFLHSPDQHLWTAMLRAGILSGGLFLGGLLMRRRRLRVLLVFLASLGVYITLGLFYNNSVLVALRGMTVVILSAWLCWCASDMVSSTTTRLRYAIDVGAMLSLSFIIGTALMV